MIKKFYCALALMLCSIMAFGSISAQAAQPSLSDEDNWIVMNETIGEAEAVLPIDVTGEFHTIREFFNGTDWVHEYLDANGNQLGMTVFFGMTPAEFSDIPQPRVAGTTINRFNITVRAAGDAQGIRLVDTTGAVRIVATNSPLGALTSLTAANEGNSGAWGQPGAQMRVRGVSRNGTAGTATFYLYTFNLQSSAVTINGSFIFRGEITNWSTNTPDGGWASFLGFFS